MSVGTDGYSEDRMALEVIAKAVPAEMIGSITSKVSAKVAWDTIRTMYVGVERVWKANKLRRKFDALKLRDGENVDDFGIRINKIAHQLAILNDVCMEEKLVRKFLQALPGRYYQIAMSIETCLDPGDMSVEELIGRLKSAKERHDLGASVARLNLTEDELVARVAARMNLSGEASSGVNRGTSLSQKRGRGRGHGGGGSRGGGPRPPWARGGNDGYAGRTGGGNSEPVDDNQCKYCGKTGHWVRECRKKKKDMAAAAAAHSAHTAQAEEEKEPMLLLATASVNGGRSIPNLHQRRRRQRLCSSRSLAMGRKGCRGCWQISCWRRSTPTTWWRQLLWHLRLWAAPKRGQRRASPRSTSRRTNSSCSWEGMASATAPGGSWTLEQPIT